MSNQFAVDYSTLSKAGKTNIRWLRMFPTVFKNGNDREELRTAWEARNSKAFIVKFWK